MGNFSLTGGRITNGLESSLVQELQWVLLVKGGDGLLNHFPGWEVALSLSSFKHGHRVAFSEQYLFLWVLFISSWECHGLAASRAVFHFLSPSFGWGQTRSACRTLICGVQVHTSQGILTLNSWIGHQRSDFGCSWMYQGIMGVCSDMLGTGYFWHVSTSLIQLAFIFHLYLFHYLVSLNTYKCWVLASVPSKFRSLCDSMCTGSWLESSAFLQGWHICMEAHLRVCRRATRFVHLRPKSGESLSTSLFCDWGLLLSMWSFCPSRCVNLPEWLSDVSCQADVKSFTSMWGMNGWMVGKNASSILSLWVFKDLCGNHISRIKSHRDCAILTHKKTLDLNDLHGFT